MIIKYFIFTILFVTSLLANNKSFMDNKVICDDLTNGKDIFVRKIPTIKKLNKIIISNYTRTTDESLKTLRIGDNRLDICVYQNESEENINYLIYSNAKKLFMNDKIIKYTNTNQGLSFRYISFEDDIITLFYETSGGNSHNYHNYKFLFSKYKDDFSLFKAIKNLSVEVENGFDLKTIEIIPKDSFLSNFDISKYIQKFDETKIGIILSDKQPLYSTPNVKTKMHLIKGDKVEVLEEKDDWYYILYHGKKDIKAWIPKSAVEETIHNKEKEPNYMKKRVERTNIAKNALGVE